MIVSNEKVVSLTYVLRENDEKGTLVESVGAEQPLEFLVGAGKMLPAFENRLIGLNKGDNFSFTLHAEDAYGTFDEKAVVDLPMELFEVEGQVDQSLLEVGRSIPMVDRDGNRFTGQVTAVQESTVTMDFNHPMAGKDLFFTGEIIGLRDATEEEITHGHAHGSDTCHDCNCGGHH